eukprot:TRINITY_DN30871_c0_g3_i2.p1 TRINITY_DN30871_c0_g3~~TRINITY_DN30871_c0_g3_i2.p1  ORF type:complete len:780 (+),score=107.62 TRINITY_DN30871_c0_g3_i2:127-2466(+)
MQPQPTEVVVAEESLGETWTSLVQRHVRQLEKRLIADCERFSQQCEPSPQQLQAPPPKSGAASSVGLEVFGNGMDSHSPNPWSRSVSDGSKGSQPLPERTKLMHGLTVESADSDEDLEVEESQPLSILRSKSALTIDEMRKTASKADVMLKSPFLSSKETEDFMSALPGSITHPLAPGFGGSKRNIGGSSLPVPTPTAADRSGNGHRPASTRSAPAPQKVFEIWPTWSANKEGGGNFARIAGRKHATQTQLVKMRQSILRAGSKEEVEKAVRRFISLTVCSPSSPFLVLWNLLFFVTMYYELCMLPMQAFDVERSDTFMAFSLLACTYWTLDILLAFNVGVIKSDGEVITDRRSIALRYMRGWMIPDTVVVVIDWVIVLYSSGKYTNLVGLLRTAKAFKYFRLLRLLRLRKLRDSFAAIDEYFNSDYLNIVRSMLANLVIVILVSHCIGCAWFAIGSGDLGYEDTWVQFFGYTNRGIWHQYFTSLHWSLTQITPGSMEITPRNPAERSFTCGILILGMLAFSSIVSSITAAMGSLKSMSARYMKQRQDLRRFVRTHGLSLELVSRIMRYSDNITRLRQQRRMALNDVELIQQLPETLFMEVVTEMFVGDIEVHPLFRILSDLSRAATQKLCHAALCENSILTYDALFRTNEVCTSMMFVVHGQLRYRFLEKERGDASPGLEDDCSPMPCKNEPSGDNIFHGLSFSSFTPTAWTPPALTHALSKVGLGRVECMETSDSSILHTESEMLKAGWRTTDLHAGSWFCEATLWTLWIHQESQRG